jgi:hypothetical protein
MTSFRAGRIGLAAVLAIYAARGMAAEPRSADSALPERVTIDVRAVDPAAGPVARIRPPALLEPADRNRLAATMPAILKAETGPFYARASALMVIKADDSQADCRAETVTIRRGDWRAQTPEAPLALDICGLLRRSARFRHAIDLNGRPLDSTARISVSFSRMRWPPAPPPIATGAPRTSGHAIDESGRWIDGAWFANRFTIPGPDWSATLPNRRGIPRKANIGVMLKLAARMGYGFIDSCKVELSSGDARLDSAICATLTSTPYREGSANQVYSGTDAYPVLVHWLRGQATMTAPARPTVPHMPRDVPLTPADFPDGTLPTPRVIPMHISLDRDGHAVGCTVTQSSGSDGWDAAGCRIALERARFTEARDWFGRPAQGLYEAVADWEAMAIRPAH